MGSRESVKCCKVLSMPQSFIELQCLRLHLNCGYLCGRFFSPALCLLVCRSHRRQVSRRRDAWHLRSPKLVSQPPPQEHHALCNLLRCAQPYVFVCRCIWTCHLSAYSLLFKLSLKRFALCSESRQNILDYYQSLTTTVRDW